MANNQPPVVFCCWRVVNNSNCSCHHREEVHSHVVHMMSYSKPKSHMSLWVTSVFLTYFRQMCGFFFLHCTIKDYNVTKETGLFQVMELWTTELCTTVHFDDHANSWNRGLADKKNLLHSKDKFSGQLTFSWCQQTCKTNQMDFPLLVCNYCTTAWCTFLGFGLSDKKNDTDDIDILELKLLWYLPPLCSSDLWHKLVLSLRSPAPLVPDVKAAWVWQRLPQD